MQPRPDKAPRPERRPPASPTSSPPRRRPSALGPTPKASMLAPPPLPPRREAPLRPATVELPDAARACFQPVAAAEALRVLSAIRARADRIRRQYFHDGEPRSTALRSLRADARALVSARAAVERGPAATREAAEARYRAVHAAAEARHPILAPFALTSADRTTLLDLARDLEPVGPTGRMTRPLDEPIRPLLDAVESVFGRLHERVFEHHAAVWSLPAVVDFTLATSEVPNHSQFARFIRAGIAEDPRYPSLVCGLSFGLGVPLQSLGATSASVSVEALRSAVDDVQPRNSTVNLPWRHFEPRQTALDVRRAQAAPTSTPPAVPAPRDTVGWSGWPSNRTAPRRQHLKVIHRGLERVGAGRMSELRQRIERILRGAPKLVAERRQRAHRLMAASWAWGRLDRSPPSAPPSPALAKAEAEFHQYRQQVEETDRLISAQQANDRRLAEQLMHDLRASLMTVRSEAEAQALAEQLSFAPSGEPYRALVHRAATDFFRMVPVALDPSRIKVIEGGARAASSPDGVLEVVSPTPEQILHELAHFAELANPQLYAAAVDWRRARGAHSHGHARIRRLRDLAPDAGYQAGEVAIEDKFFDPYVGAAYENRGMPTTEVLSTGLQKFARARDMLELFARDPEHFMFVVGVLTP